MDEQILKLLRDHAPGFVSGEEMSRHLGVTRTAIWKRVGTLKNSGYNIEASRRLGYRLLQSPDLLSPAEVRPFLRTRWIGKTIHYFRTVDSTNAQAYQLALRGAGEGEIVVAESQEKGRGRLGRRWFSPPFRNLYLSVILRPKIPPHQAPLITLMAAVATAEAIEKTSGLHPMMKWPNDLLMKGRKLAGLLNEIHSETDRVHFVILGIGVNLNTDERAFSKEIRDIATSLKRETGKDGLTKDFSSASFADLGEMVRCLQQTGRLSHLAGLEELGPNRREAGEDYFFWREPQWKGSGCGFRWSTHPRNGQGSEKEDRGRGCGIY